MKSKLIPRTVDEEPAYSFMISAIMHIIHPSLRFPSLKLTGEWDRDPIRRRGGEVARRARLLRK